MTEFLQQIEQFHFLRPLWLLAILPAIILIALMWRRKAAYGTWQRVISPHLLPHLLSGNVTQQSKTPLVLLLISWILASIAMAGPTWRTLPQAVQKKVDAQVIVLDLSLSMYAKDMAPSRMMRARMKLTDILNRTEEGLTALVVYAGTPHVVTPLTDDTNTILSMVNSLSPDIMPIKGSNPIEAVKHALNVFKLGGVEGGRILLMTDDLPANFVDEVEPHFNSQTTLSILGIGTPQGAPISLPDGSFVKQANGTIVVPKLQTGTLKTAARQLNGRFSTMTATDEDINYLLTKDLMSNNQEVKETDREFDVWDESGHWLVLFILPLAAAAYRKGWLGSFLIPLMGVAYASSYSPKAQAFGWDDLWQTQDQQAIELLRKGNVEQAAETFNDPNWKASSQYRAQNFEAAEDLFSQSENADGLYNLGNAQAKQQKFDEAITSYQKALELNPDMEDAQHNLELVKKAKEQQQQENDQNQESGDKGDQQQDSEQQQNQDQQNQNDQQQNQDQQSDQEQQSDQQSQQDEQQNQSEQNESESDQEQTEQEQQQQQSKAEQEQQNQEQQEQEQTAMQQPMERTEDQQALEQWLRRVPDDPGGLLRRKFQQESQLRNNAPRGEEIW